MTKQQDWPLTAAEAELESHVVEWHRASGGDPLRCADCGRLVLAVVRERAGVTA